MTPRSSRVIPNGRSRLLPRGQVATVSGKDLRTVRRSADEWNTPAVSFSLTRTAEGGSKRPPAENIGNQIAIILDNKVISAPRVESVIPPPRAGSSAAGSRPRKRRTGRRAQGRLSPRASYLEERTVRSLLGADSVRQG